LFLNGRHPVTRIGKALQHGKATLKGLVLPRPRAPGEAPANGPLVIAGFFSTGSGLGRAARSCYDALSESGLDVQAVDVSDLMNQSDLPPSVPLSVLDPKLGGTLILFVNPPELERALLGLGLRRWHNWRIIGAWAWELPVAPAGWARQARLVSEVWAPSQFVADAFAAAYDRPVRTVPHYVPVLPPCADRPADGTLRVLVSADARSSLDRKNPLSALRMFRDAFPSDERVSLTVKCRNLQLASRYQESLRQAMAGDNRIILIDETLTDAAQQALLAESDVVLSPHRSEGFGLLLADAMAQGKCVVATGWSGNLEYMAPDAACLLPYRMVPVVDATGVYAPGDGAEWAEADHDAGVAALRSLGEAPELRHEMSRRARAQIAARLRRASYVEALQPA
jgi:glycosyltransferase involved in cell wall biosynthesis